MISRTDLVNTLEDAPRRMLAPSAYSDALFPSLRLTRTARLVRRIGRWLFLLLVVAFGFIAFAPWQQFVQGSGSVVAFKPGERPQTLEAPTEGRLVRWGEGIHENAHVSAGQLIAEIQDVDPNLLSRLEEQLTAAEAQVLAAQGVVDANERALDAVEANVSSFDRQLMAYRAVKDLILASADAEVQSAANKVDAERRQLDEQQAALAQSKADFERQQQLFRENIVAEGKYQLAEQKYLESRAKVEKAEAYVRSAVSDLEAKQFDRQAKEQKAQVNIDYAIANLGKARADANKARSEVEKARTDLQKAMKERSEMETKVSRQRSQQITAPFDGFINKIEANQGGKILKKGDKLCEIVPDTSELTVQIWLDGNDAPLVEPGRHVRLQFEGWPAIQFAGWPSVAYGTFGGTVVSVDATDNGKGKFRVLVKPDPDSKEWPDERYLRQGVRANGWVLLNKVDLWYEIWRQMNGFPPVISDEAPEKDEKSKPPKLPKA